MTTSRFLPILNLVGCLLITGVILAQWLKERGLDARIDGLNQQLVAARGQYEAEKKRVLALENDISQLKESVESTIKAKKETEDVMAKMIAETEAQTAAVATTNQSNLEQVKIWEKAIADRDAKIRELNQEIIATRRRLDEAVSKLKEVGDR